jgi:hypothetical protein
MLSLWGCTKYNCYKQSETENITIANIRESNILDGIGGNRPNQQILG